MEHPVGFEPTPTTWQAVVLPLTPWTRVAEGRGVELLRRVTPLACFRDRCRRRLSA